MSDHDIQKIVIVGGGTAGWMAAAALASLLKAGINICLIESDDIGTVGVGEATIPPLIAFNTMLGINEDMFLKATMGTFKLGIEFVNWGACGERYFHPFGPHGQDFQGINFHQLYLREAQSRNMPPIQNWSMSASAAALGKFARPGPDARLPLSQLAYAFHFDAGLYAAFLRQLAEGRGVSRIEGKIVDAGLADNGDIANVRLDDGRIVEGELFIDCSGFRGLLIEDKLGTGYDDWSQWLPCDRAVAVPSKLLGPADPFTRSTAHHAGWQWRIPLQHRMGNGLVYSSSFLDSKDAISLLLSAIEGDALATPRQLSFTAGRRRRAWNRNVVSLGLSSGFVEPLESTSIHLIQSGIAKLLALFPDRRFDPLERDEYNRQMQAVFEDVRDFVILHYKATRRDDSEFWNYCRTMDVPDSLSTKLDLWKSKGRLFREGFELFGTASWVAVLLGQGIVPAETEPAAFAIDPAMTSDALEKMRTSYTRMAEHLPRHEDFIAQVCAAG
ncbi:tryptophan halogenase family protein [Sphingorhabdus contaminans]|uniref:Tryptophan 7-halogenase n=1 Tax=Sphingorhabdus contaminans TaxID=1343899 RepID=A0A553WK55_9SPHN|nr:tryptophan halogenase family protein [Sphingorhabdus contaminans]TSB05034.1 tryptophan 7-halogenase [Sphingorhabdus contaminans]